MHETLTISTILISEESKKSGFSVEVIGNNYVLISKNDNVIYLKGSRNSFLSSIGSSVTNNKDVTKIFFSRFNIPTAKHIVVKDFDTFSKIENLDLIFPIVIKPTDGSRGRNVYIGIKNLEDAKKVVTSLEGKAKKLILEEMLVGDEYRVTCVDYKVVAVSMRKPAFVTGDGVKTIQELIEEKNNLVNRQRILNGKILAKIEIKIDDFLMTCLNEQNLTLNSIPKDKIEVYLRKNSNISTGGDGYNIDLENVHPKNIQLFEKITKICDLNVSGIDIMCEDLSIPIINQKNAGVVEINDSPGIGLPQFPINGKPVNVAEKIVEMIEKYMSK